MSFPANVRPAAAFLLDNSVKATLLFATTWAVAFALRKHSAALRHQMWVAALAASVALPMVAPILPAWRSRTLSLAVERLTGTSQSAGSMSPGSSLVVNAGPATNHAASWPGVLLLVWSVGTVLALTRFGAGFAYMARVRAHSTRLTDERSIRDVTQIARAFQIRRAIHLFESADPAAMPLAWGALRPKILLPGSAREWPDDRRYVVLCHELAHVRRHDCAAQILGELARAIYWFNPLAWLAVYRLRRESEYACDDSVLNTGIEAQDYADDLLALTRMLQKESSKWLPALAMARSNHLERRITAMLNPTADRRRTSSKSRGIVSFIALLLLLSLAAVRLSAQNTAAFSGTVYGPDGAAASDATVILIDVPRNTRDMTASGADGRFEITGLPPSDYEVQVMKLGCQTYDLPNVPIRPGETRSLDVNLVTGSTEAPTVPHRKQVLRIDGNVEASKAFTTVTPQYPAAAKSHRIQGTVVLHALVAKDGLIESLVVTNQADPLFARSAVEAVSHWRYLPTLLNGQPVAVDTEISVVYSVQP